MRYLGNYEIRRAIGQGANGVVYRARERGTRKQVAIKVLRQEVQRDREARGRFWRESRAASAIDHPNVAKVLEAGRLAPEDESEEPILYLVMELVGGHDLLRKMAIEDLDVRTVADIGRQVAEGLAAAHACGVIHRDLKPGNIRVTSQGKVKLLDFGLAKLLDLPETEEPSDEELFTSQVGSIVGTAYYMAPEQVRGEAVDERADLFALGILLYQMLTDRLPFKGATLPEYLAEIEQKEAAPVQAHRPDVPPCLAAIVGRLLHKAPADRYQTASEVARDLTRFLAVGEAEPVPQSEGEEPVAPATSPSSTTWRSWLRRRG